MPKSLKTDSRPLERKRTVSLKDLMMGVMMGSNDEDAFISLANRLVRLERQITDTESGRISELTNGISLGEIARSLLAPHDRDRVIERAELDGEAAAGNEPPEEIIENIRQTLVREAAVIFTGPLIDYLDNARRVHEQIVDTVNLDRVLSAGWDVDARERAEDLARDFAGYIEANKDEITALSIFYNQPYRQRAVTYRMVGELLERLKQDRPHLAPLRVWQAYEQIDRLNGGNPQSELIALVALVRRVVGIDGTLTPYEATVNRNFQDWVFRKQAGALKFTSEQMEWLRMIKEHIATSFHLASDDLDYAPFDAKGGIGKMYQVFGDDMDGIIEEMNEELAA
jgi:type I restriction enzyme R subunit